MDSSKCYRIVKETIADSKTLSGKDKIDILEWLSTKIDKCKCDSSCSTESAVAGSRKSGIRLENASSEPPHQDSEIPKKRRRLSEVGIQKENKTRIDQYFSVVKGELSQVRKDNTNKNLNESSVQNTILNEEGSGNDQTPKSSQTSNTLVNSPYRKTRLTLKRLVNTKFSDKENDATVSRQLQENCKETEQDLDDNNLKNNSGTQKSISENVLSPKNVNVKEPLNYPPAKLQSPSQTKKSTVYKSFLASLSKDVPLEEADPKAVRYRVNYSLSKEELCTDLYKLFNEKVFDNKLPEDMKIQWSDQLKTAAGKFKCNKMSSTVKQSEIVLSIKILDTPDKLRDTFIHEMCHAAVRLIDNVSESHGPNWKAWTIEAVQLFQNCQQLVDVIIMNLKQNIPTNVLAVAMLGEDMSSL